MRETAIRGKARMFGSCFTTASRFTVIYAGMNNCSNEEDTTAAKFN